jgi:hypothetical protein
MKTSNKPGQDDATLALMPDLAQSYYGFRHTVHSALQVLESLAVPSSRITLRMAAAGGPAAHIARQSPAPGAPLFEDTQITLHVSGLGFCHSLPVPMWQRGGDEGPGTMDMLELLDDPLQKCLHWIHEGARLFDISPDDHAACARWIALFGLSPEQWPTEYLYPVALILPSLHSLAGTEAGIRLGLDLVLHLPLSELRPKRGSLSMKRDNVTLLGKRLNRLSVDYVLGDRCEDTGAVELVLGPVDLETYYKFSEPEGLALLNKTLRLLMPCHGEKFVSWVVADPTKFPALGIARENSLLGVNTYLGPRERRPVAARV